MYMAEDVPWYMVDSNQPRPWSDDDMGMSAPVIIGKFDSEAQAREALFRKLMEQAEYNFVKRSGESGTYRAAAMLILEPETSIKIYGRFYRVREVE